MTSRTKRTLLICMSILIAVFTAGCMLGDMSIRNSKSNDPKLKAEQKALRDLRAKHEKIQGGIK